MPAETPRERSQSRLRRVLARLPENRWLNVTSLIVGVIGLGLAVLGFIVFTGEDENPELLRLGQEGMSGPFAFTPTSVQCGRSISDVPAEAVAGMPDVVRSSIQKVCEIPIHIRNDSNYQLPGAIIPVLFVGNEQFPQFTAMPPASPLLNPHDSTDVDLLF
jgi:hypothetical protein